MPSCPCRSVLPPCPCVLVKLCSFRLLFSRHDFVFDTGENCKCVLSIDNPAWAQSLQFSSALGAVSIGFTGLFCITVPKEKIQTSTFIPLIKCSSSPESLLIQISLTQTSPNSFNQLKQMYLFYLIYLYSINITQPKVSPTVEWLSYSFGLWVNYLITGFIANQWS